MTSETDALAHRVDQIVEDVGIIKGRVESVHGGVNELRNALAVLVKHEVLMEQQALAAQNHAQAVVELGRRLTVVEVEMPQLKETRTWVVRGMLLALTSVGLAVLGLVLRHGP